MTAGLPLISGDHAELSPMGKHPMLLIIYDEADAACHDLGPTSKFRGPADATFFRHGISDHDDDQLAARDTRVALRVFLTWLAIVLPAAAGTAGWSCCLEG